ncbi:MAG TPA: PIN domain-containing protein [Ideonella sp.]|uniref:PIN domain-containing protein n=1 Tax=Ideonella sp. TaxID=1929293 RepID=UPI002C0CB747|nr:PIN domain-containing protein [Ideonella sp.]HSI47527.1 PIN domain-containing protein [Ideonella sp.]
MTLYMLDTNAVSAVMRGSAAMDAKLQDLDRSAWCISAITHAEICFGLALRPEAAKLARAAQLFFAATTTAPWDQVAAEAHGRLRAQLRLAGTPIGDFDEMIAAHALAMGAMLVSDNERHFARVAGLTVVNWRRGGSAG